MPFTVLHLKKKKTNGASQNICGKRKIPFPPKIVVVVLDYIFIKNKTITTFWHKTAKSLKMCFYLNIACRLSGVLGFAMSH